jgi:hypothetical protein
MLLDGHYAGGESETLGLIDSYSNIIHPDVYGIRQSLHSYMESGTHDVAYRRMRRVENEDFFLRMGDKQIRTSANLRT